MELIIIVMSILALQHYKKFKDIKRQDVLANYRAAERMGRNRLESCEKTGVLFQYSYFDKMMYFDCKLV